MDDISKEGTKMKAVLLSLVLLAAFAVTAYAQSTKYYRSNGSYAGRSVSSGNTTKFYDSRGLYTGRTTTSGGTTKYYGSNGSYRGRSTSR